MISGFRRNLTSYERNQKPYPTTTGDPAPCVQFHWLAHFSDIPLGGSYFSYSGWYAFRISTMGYVKMFLFILIGYLLVMVLDFRRIKRIPMDQALKNVE